MYNPLPSCSFNHTEQDSRIGIILEIEPSRPTFNPVCSFQNIRDSDYYVIIIIRIGVWGIL